MTMRYGEVPGVGKPVSRLAQGMMMVTTDKLDESFALLDAALAAGINTFDSAHVYGGGKTDTAFGRWVRERGVRERVVLLEKGAHHNAQRQRVTPQDIRDDLDECLRRLQFDYVDLFVLHRDDPGVPVEPIVDVLNELKAAGRLRAFGGSNWSHERVAAANRYAAAHGLTPFACSSPHFSLAEMVREPWGNCVSIAGPAGAAARAWYGAQNMPLFTWSSLARGFFSGRYDRAAMEARPADDPEIAVRCFRSEDNLRRLDRVHALAARRGLTVPQVAGAYVLNYPLNIFALVGAFTAREIDENVAVMDVRLTPQEMAWLNLEDGA